MTAFDLPSVPELRNSFAHLSRQVESISRCESALASGLFTHPDGRTDELGITKISLEQAALLSHLCIQCPLALSVEVGFGMGSSAAVILGTRTFLKKPFEHLIFDPYGLLEGRGQVVQSY